MFSEAEALLEAGARALETGRWRNAAESYRAVLDLGEIPMASLGLGTALWWLGDMRGAIDHLERAYAELMHLQDPANAATCALRLAYHNRAHLANAVGADAWMVRGARLVEDHRLEALRGELLLATAGLTEDPREAESFAREAVGLARAREDPDLEVRARGQLGSSLVEQGKTGEGFELLDESLVSCLGQPRSLNAFVFVGGLMMASGARCADFPRATRWVRALDEIAERYDSPVVYAECRMTQAKVLLAMGEWRHAAEAANTVIDLSRDSVPAFHAEALTVLAEVRLSQGRMEEAERLLSGFEGHPAAVPVLARIHLHQGRPALAATALRRRLDLVGSQRRESALLQEILGEVDVARGVPVVADRGRALLDLGATLDCKLVEARGHRLLARALLGEDLLVARRHLDLALAAFVHLKMPYEEARTRHLIAQAIRPMEPDLAKLQARAALATFDELGAGRDADLAAALLR